MLIKNILHLNVSITDFNLIQGYTHYKVIEVAVQKLELSGNAQENK